MLDRIAYSLASLSLGSADFSLASEEEFDSFAPPSDNKPTSLTGWFKPALRMAWLVSCVYRLDCDKYLVRRRPMPGSSHRS